jgi:hypothetical protein
VLGLVGAREFWQGRLHVFSSPREDSNATCRSGDILDRLLCRGGAPRLWGGTDESRRRIIEVM